MLRRKLVFRLTPDDDGYPPIAAESVWVTHQEGDRYIINNIPFFSYDATIDDVVEAVEIDGDLQFSRLKSASKNSLLRVLYSSNTEPSKLIRDLGQMGCLTEEFSNYGLLAISVPEEVDIHQVISYLHKGLEQGQWEYEEAILRH